MENQQYQRWVVGAFMATAALAAFVLLSLSLRVAGYYDLETQVRNVDFILRMVSIGFGLLLFFGLYRNSKSNLFMNEVVSELAKVTWPTQKETTSATIVTIIMVIISGIILWVLDNVWAYVLQQII